MKLKPVNLLLIIALIAGSFYLGTTWKKETATTVERIPTEDKIPNRVIPTRPANNNLSDRLNRDEEATINLFENAAPSVVFITTTALQRNRFTRDVTEIPRGTGSGFVWDLDGHIITNYHVVQGVAENGDKVSVTFYDQSTWDAEVVGYAAEKDLAVLKIDAPRELLRPIPLGTSENLKVGQSTYAIGNPFGLDQTLTTGIVSALGREIESIGRVQIRDVIQTDAAINPGNSGGPLLNSAGELIGVNTAIYSPSGAYAGIGFSIPVDAVRTVIPDLIQYGKINRPTIGIYPYTQGGTQIEGVLILDIVDGGGAEKAGLRPSARDRYGRIILGDVITAIDGNEITSYSDLILTLDEYQSGDMVQVRVRRDGEEVEVPVELGTGIQ
ncbi:MAG: trypsin-like peptidase domain-containing protein [Bacteroidota bacterium]